MTLTVKHATLSSRLYKILITPFVFMGVSMFLHLWKVALIAVICVGMLMTGAMQFALPQMVEIKRELPIWISVVCFLWLVATFLTILDHFRFRGWTHDPAEPSVIASATLFLEALFNRNGKAPKSFLGMRTVKREQPASNLTTTS